jgi:hypothetical protein
VRNCRRYSCSFLIFCSGGCVGDHLFRVWKLPGHNAMIAHRPNQLSYRSRWTQTELFASMIFSKKIISLGKMENERLETKILRSTQKRAPPPPLSLSLSQKMAHIYIFQERSCCGKIAFSHPLDFRNGNHGTKDNRRAILSTCGNVQTKHQTAMKNLVMLLEKNEKCIRKLKFYFCAFKSKRQRLVNKNWHFVVVGRRGLVDFFLYFDLNRIHLMNSVGNIKHNVLLM